MNDEIMERFYELSTLNIIPDMHTHAENFNSLGDWADISERPNTAHACRTKARYYMGLAGGSYIRLMDGSFAELIPTEQELEPEGVMDWQERKDLS